MHFVRAISYVTVFFTSVILLEACISVFGRRKVYGVPMTAANLAVRRLRTLNWITFLPTLAIYAWLYAHTQALHFRWDPNGAGTWAAALVLSDLAFYVYHVAAHRWNLLWSAHVVHHQSTEFNMSLAGRDGIFESLFLGPCLLPCAVIGIPPPVIFTSFLAVMLVMGTFHCHVGGSFGPLGWIFNTPSHHRLHHRRDVGRHGTRNFGAVLIVWDRIFGTFHVEGSEPFAFGVAHEAPIYDPWRCQTYYFAHLFRQLRRAPPRRKLDLLFAAEMPGPSEELVTAPISPRFMELVPLLLAIDVVAMLVIRVSGHARPDGHMSWPLATSASLALFGLALLLARRLTAKGQAWPGLACVAVGAAGLYLTPGSLGSELWDSVQDGFMRLLAVTLLILLALAFTPRPTEATPAG